MSLSTADAAHLLAALTVLLLAAHAGGRLFARLRQPPVVGEIVGGLLLGPTVLGALAPGVTDRLLPAAGPVAAGLETVYQVGVLLLVFLAGAELRVKASARERRTATAVAAAGLLVPFAVGVLVVHLTGVGGLAGPHGSAVSVALVFGTATAVAAIPVISRIMTDLGVQHTPFARVVLIVAVAEDAVLYLVLAVVLGLATAESAEGAVGLWAAVGSDAPAPTMAYQTLATLGLCCVAVAAGPRGFRWLAARRWNLVERHNPTAFRLVVLLAGVSACAALGINTVFGALLAGLCAARGDAAAPQPQDRDRAAHAWQAIRDFSLAFFVPLYFALVGLRLDLARQLDVVFFAWFCVLACAVKGGSVWAAAVLAGERRATATHLAVALNARGTLGVLVATVTHAAGVISTAFFTSLVLLSLVTSQAAGFLLARGLRREPASPPAAAARPRATPPAPRHPTAGPAPATPQPASIPQEVP